MTLELPVFHIGYFGQVINILQTICKVLFTITTTLEPSNTEHLSGMLARSLDGHCEAKVSQHHELKTFIRQQEEAQKGDPGSSQENIRLPQLQGHEWRCQERSRSHENSP